MSALKSATVRVTAVAVMLLAGSACDGGSQEDSPTWLKDHGYLRHAGKVLDVGQLLDDVDSDKEKHLSGSSFQSTALDSACTYLFGTTDDVNRDLSLKLDGDLRAFHSGYGKNRDSDYLSCDYELLGDGKEDGSGVDFRIVGSNHTLDEFATTGESDFATTALPDGTQMALSYSRIKTSSMSVPNVVDFLDDRGRRLSWNDTESAGHKVDE